MVGVRSLVAVGAGAALTAGVLVAVLASRPGVQPAELPEMGAACTQAAQVKLDPLVTLPSGKYRAEQDGAEWIVRTSVNHKTKWMDNWYDVSCVVSGVSVVSVDATRR